MKKKVLKYIGIITLVIVVFTTGAYAEVAGFIQRGLLETGLFNPKVSNTTVHESAENKLTKADFNLDLINSKGERISLSQFKGKVIFMNLWATWCPPCKAEMPSINSLYNTVSKEDIKFVMISLDKDFETAKRYIKDKGFNFEIYRLDGELPSVYSTNSIPTTFVIDSRGDIALTHKGMADYSDIKFIEFLERL